MNPFKDGSVGRSRNLGRERGFTLIELLLVLVILTVLAAVVAPKLAGRSKQARITAARTDISNLETALDSFEMDAGRYPTTDEGLRALVERPPDVAEWHGPFIKRGTPKDPWGNLYDYKYPGDHNTNSYDLSSAGPDGNLGTDDDIDNWSER